MKEEGALTISELAEQASVTPRTVRYYVAEGLLPPPLGSGQQRVYTREHLLRLELIKRLKQAYLPLHEIRARLERLSLAEMERLLAELSPAPGPPPAGGALEYVRRVQETLGGHVAGTPPVVAFADRPSPPDRLPPGHPPAIESEVATASPPPAPDPARSQPPPGGVWHRVTLAPGVELHYQPSTSRERASAIARLIAEASRIFGEAFRPERGDDQRQEPT